MKSIYYFIKSNKYEILASVITIFHLSHCNADVFKVMTTIGAVASAEIVMLITFTAVLFIVSLAIIIIQYVVFSKEDVTLTKKAVIFIEKLPVLLVVKLSSK